MEKKCLQKNLKNKELQQNKDKLGISKEDFKKETRAERKKRMMAELNKLSKGGLAGRIAKRGYGKARK